MLKLFYENLLDLLLFAHLNMHISANVGSTVHCFEAFAGQSLSRLGVRGEVVYDQRGISVTQGIKISIFE